MTLHTSLFELLDATFGNALFIISVVMTRILRWGFTAWLIFASWVGDGYAARTLEALRVENRKRVKKQKPRKLSKAARHARQITINTNNDIIARYRNDAQWGVGSLTGLDAYMRAAVENNRLNSDQSH